MNGRLIAIGDIHGCAVEFDELISQLALQPADRVVLLGDLINRGPDPCAVLDKAREIRAISIMGNHELRLLHHHKFPGDSIPKPEDEATLAKLRPPDWDYIEKLPLTHYEESLNTVFVHGGFLPNQPWQKQPADVVTRIQVIDKEGRPRKRAESAGSPLWADLWSGPPFVVYGHTPRPKVYKLKWSLGIDTACVFGGSLTAYILPERRLVHVKARRRYFQ